MEPAEIKARYRAIGLTGRELAKRAQVDHATVSRLLNGRTSPILRTLNKVSAALVAAEMSRRDDLIERHGLPDLPECDTIRVGGVLRRLVKPTVDPRQENAA